jgi:hypothetical protein
MGKDNLPKRTQSCHSYFCPYCGYRHEHTGNISDLFSHPMKFQSDQRLDKIIFHRIVLSNNPLPKDVKEEEKICENANCGERFYIDYCKNAEQGNNKKGFPGLATNDKFVLEELIDYTHTNIHGIVQFFGLFCVLFAIPEFFIGSHRGIWTYSNESCGLLFLCIGLGILIAESYLKKRSRTNLSKKNPSIPPADNWVILKDGSVWKNLLLNAVVVTILWIILLFVGFGDPGKYLVYLWEKTQHFEQHLDLIKWNKQSYIKKLNRYRNYSENSVLFR